MKSITKIRRAAKQVGLKIRIKTYPGIGRTIQLCTTEGNPVGNTFVVGSELYEKVRSFYKTVDVNTLQQLLEENSDPFDPLTGIKHMIKNCESQQGLTTWDPLKPLSEV